jgi:hypothetical protein
MDMRFAITLALYTILAAAFICGAPIGAHAAEPCHDLNMTYQRSFLAMDQWKLDHPGEAWYQTSLFIANQKAYLAWNACWIANEQ